MYVDNMMKSASATLKAVNFSNSTAQVVRERRFSLDEVVK